MAWNDSNTVLLVESNTTDASTTFTDTSNGGSTHTLTANGDVQHDTAQKKFGATSMLFDGTGDYLSASSSADWQFGTGDFTIDAWIRADSVSNGRRVGALGDVESVNGTWCFGFGTQWGGGTKINFADRISGSINDHLSSAVTINTGTWYHIAIVRDSGTLRFFLDGVSKGTASCSHDLNASDTLYTGARDSPGGMIEFLSGHLDGLRISKGIARWTSGFTPPAILYGDDSNHALSSDQPSVVLILAILIVNDSTHVHTPDQPTLLAIYNLTVADSDHALTNDTFLLVIILEPNDSTHALSSDQLGSVVFLPAGEVLISFTGYVPAIEWTGAKPEIEIIAQTPSIEFSYDT